MSNPTDATAPDATPTNVPDSDRVAADAGATPADDGAPEGGKGDEPVQVVDREQADLAAFDKGLATLTDADAPKTAADVAANAAAAAQPPAAAPAPVSAPAAAPAPAAEADPELDREVKELGLKGRTEERFREMSSQLKEVAPLREVLTKHQITDPARIEQVIETAARAQEWEDTVLASTATPEQFGMALNVIKAMNSGDPKVMTVAFDTMLQEVAELGKQLGREVPGIVDPLQAHPDLQQEVSEGDLTRKRALEIAAQRATAAATNARDTARSTQIQHEAAVNQALNDVKALNDQLKAGDSDFARKLALLQPTLDVIRETVHPSQWVARIERAYRALPPLPAAAPAPAPATAPRVPVSHMPVRPTGGNLTMRQKPKSDLEAFEMGLRSLQPE
jgi:hypothetical protein